MQNNSVTLKLFAIAVIGGACLVASLAILGLVSERQSTGRAASDEVALLWSGRQTLAGPMLIYKTSVAGIPHEHYVLPNSLRYETTLVPEVRSRGIFKTVVYKSVVKVQGEFKRTDILPTFGGAQNALLGVGISDTHGIEHQFDITWGNKAIPFEPGAGVDLAGMSGLHANVPLQHTSESLPFSFEVELKGSKGISVAPLGRETSVTVASSWQTPKFVGAFLPSSHEITNEGFSAKWQISSFGRSYPQSFDAEDVGFDQILGSAAGADLHQVIDIYDMVFRSVKYAVLFIVITFAVFFLFDILGGVRVHPIQYLLIGAALALFYLLLLSLSERVGFFAAYLLATVMTIGLVTFYSSSVLKRGNRALLIGAVLGALYGYLYLILQLEEFALLAGSLVLFCLLAGAMYATRTIDWFSLEKKG